MWVLFRPEKQVFDLWSGWSVTLSRLFVASFSRYPEYERCNSAACTRVNAFLNATNKPLSDFQRLTACPENRSPRILEHIVCTDDGRIGFVALACGGGQFIRLDEQGIMLFGITGYEIGVGTKRGDGANDVQV